MEKIRRPPSSGSNNNHETSSQDDSFTHSLAEQRHQARMSRLFRAEWEKISTSVIETEERNIELEEKIREDAALIQVG
jgi:hypothetical protein